MNFPSLSHLLALRQRPRVLAGAVGGALLLLLASLLFMGKKAPIEDEGVLYRVSAEPFTVRISESGSIASRDRVVIKSQVRGQRSVIFLIEEGTEVAEGDLLIELDSSQLEDKLVEEEIELENAEAELISARENLAVVRNQAQADIAKARLDFQFAKQDLENYREGDYKMLLKRANSRITLARAELQQAEDRLAGSQRLFDNRYISETELESDQLARQRAETDLELVIEEKRILETFTFARQMTELESDVEQTELALERAERRASANIAQAEARLSARQAEVQRERVSVADLREQISYCRIIAPTSGMVIYAPQGNRWSREALEEGTDVRERQELIYLPTADAMSANIKVHETMLNKLELGLRASITVDALPNQPLTGRVSEIAVMPEDGGWRNSELKQYATEIAINETLPSLRSGMTCKADILVASYDSVLTVPLQAVLQVEGQPCVFVPGRGGKPVPRPVELGLDNNRKIHILSGLEEGDRVLLNPPLSRAERGAVSDDFDAGTT